MGSLFGALLARAGHTVWMVDNHPERARIMAAQGIHVEAPGGALHVSVNATTNPRAVPAPDFAFISVKAYDTAAAADSATAFAAPETTFVSLQNGLGNIETLVSRFGAERVIGGTTAHGATELAPAYVRHAGAGVTVVGAAAGKPSERVAALTQILRGAGLEVEVTDDLVSAVWSKVIVNCGINALGALTRLPNGALIEDAGAAAVLRAAVEEAAAVAAMKGIALAYCDPVEHTRQVCRATAQNVNSMLQDVLRGRRTEVEAINGAVAREGRGGSFDSAQDRSRTAPTGVATPVNDALSALVGVIERGYGRQVPPAPGAS